MFNTLDSIRKISSCFNFLDVEFGNEVDCSYSNKKQLPENRDTSLTSETTEKVENYESFTAESDVQMNINENKHNQQGKCD